MTLVEEYIIRHNININPADYGFEIGPELIESSTSIRVIRSEVSIDSLWSFFIHHHNLENFTRRENLRNEINREQQIVFQAFPYLSSVWENWRISTPTNFEIINRN